MRNHASQYHSLILFAFFLGGFLFIALPAQAEHIVLTQDGQGRLVYINVADPQPASGSPPFRAMRPSYLPLPESSEKLSQWVEQASGRFNLDPRLVDAVIRVESGYNPRAVSPKGARGLMQLIPATAQRFGVQNPWDPKQNIQGGASYLRYLLDLFKGNVPLTLAAYNAGEHSVLRNRGIPAIPETVDYVQKVTSLYEGSGAPQGKITAQPQLPRQETIDHYVDAQGVIHFTNDGGF
jgi:soluble lytic murein transglycosylase-like protein